MSIRLNHSNLGSLASVDEILCRGNRQALTELLAKLAEAPDGALAERVLTLYARQQHRAGDPEFTAWPQYQAAYWTVCAVRETR